LKEVIEVPIYEYQCSQCSEIFEAFQKITDLPLTQCRFCQGKVEQLISHTSFQLKGSGWYLTDYAKKSQPAASASTSDSSKAAESKATSTDKGNSTAPKSGKDST
jgi:putative FmdB family regulatory protein